MEKSKLLSIGELSKMSGVHIKSLRYYDRIGVLPPAYTDPDSGYRYYSFSQLFLLDAIQLCIELDIPLKDFNRFISKDGKIIYYDLLFSHGKEIATEKISQINQKLYMLDKAQSEIERSSSLKTEIAKPFFMDEQICILVPFEGSQSDYSFHLTLKQIVLGLTPSSVSQGKEVGLIKIFQNGSWQKYIYATIDAGIDCNFNTSKMFVIPKGIYMCKECRCGDIDRAEEIFSQISNKPGIVIETELLLQSYDFTQPRYELRCHMFE